MNMDTHGESLLSVYPKIDLPPSYSDEMRQNAVPMNVNPSAPPVQLVVTQPPPLQPVINNIFMTDADRGPGITCPACRARVKVTVKHHPTWKTHCLAGFLCLFFCWPCVCLPCCCNCCYRTTQYCPNCNIVLGSVAY